MAAHARAGEETNMAAAVEKVARRRLLLEAPTFFTRRRDPPSGVRHLAHVPPEEVQLAVHSGNGSFLRPRQAAPEGEVSWACGCYKRRGWERVGWRGLPAGHQA